MEEKHFASFNENVLVTFNLINKDKVNLINFVVDILRQGNSHNKHRAVCCSLAPSLIFYFLLVFAILLCARLTLVVFPLHPTAESGAPPVVGGVLQIGHTPSTRALVSTYY